MPPEPTHSIGAAEIALPSSDVAADLAFFTETLGFRIDTIFPADNPSVAVISGYGLRIRLSPGTGSPGVLRLLCHHPATVAGGETELTAPNGTRIEIVDADPRIELPPVQQSFFLKRQDENSDWVVGRAGMRYRDLIPDRQGGRFIASHIQIPTGGPVPDYVHFHRIRFQMIYCYKGWVRVAYEDQGPPLSMQAGDCVLQPPQIRHRVLECSPGLEVIEIGSPADHETHADHDLILPTPDLRPDRDFDGQRFVHHQGADARWKPWRSGFEVCDTGIAEATNGLASARIARPSVTTASQSLSPWCREGGEFYFMFVLRGAVALHREGHDAEKLTAGDCFAIPAQMQYGLADGSKDLELLEVSLPAES